MTAEVLGYKMTQVARSNVWHIIARYVYESNAYKRVMTIENRLEPIGRLTHINVH